MAASLSLRTAKTPSKRSRTRRISEAFSWPGGKTLAVWIAPNVEVWHFDSAVGTGISPNPANRVPDVINYAWREYGMRVGLWRMADVLEQCAERNERNTDCKPGEEQPRQGNDHQYRSRRQRHTAIVSS